MPRFISLCLTIFMGFTAFAFAQDRFDNVEIKTIPVAKGIYMLQGRGGNIGISVGEDGVFIIDDQFSPLTPKILAAIKAITDQPIKFLINTHYHGDHTGGNENLGKMDVIITAHDNVYRRLHAAQKRKIAAGEDAPSDASLPVITFNDGMTFHINGLKIKAHHFAHGHTDGDSVIHFKGANAVHMGDLFFNGFYPYIDNDAGGNIYGLMAAGAVTLKQIDDGTKIIPGHGPLASKADLQRYLGMLDRVIETLDPLAKKGTPVEDVLKMDPLKDFNDQWGGGFMKPDRFLGIIYPMILEHHK